MCRPGWDEYFLEIAKLTAIRTTCLRRAVGCVIVRDRWAVCGGYNGAPRGAEHCREVGCKREQMGIVSGQRAELCRGVHAEQNAIIQAAVHGVSIEGGTLYCTTSPCSICLKMLINAKIVRIVYKEGYPDELAKQIAEESGYVWEEHEIRKV